MPRHHPIVVLLTLALCATIHAADPVDSPTQRDPSAQPPDRRFDGSRLRAAREARSKDAAAADASKLKRLTWTMGDVSREALVYVPPGENKNAPVVFAFHGHGGRAEYSARKFDVHTLWPEAICVYPQGLPTPSPKIDPDGKMPGWQKSVGDQDDRDLKFFDAMLKTLKADFKIDEKRVYVTGHSNGGFFTYVLWAARGDAIAAVAPVAAFLDLKDAKSMKPKPVLHVAGEKDPLVKFALQQRTIAADRKLNGCDETGKPAGEFCTEYTSKSGPPVVTFIHPSGHEIPEGAPKRIVEFFKAQGGKKSE